MGVTRRDFLKVGASGLTVLGVTLYRLPVHGDGKPSRKVAEVPVIWMATGSCTGCSVSLLNTDSPTIQELLVSEVLPGKHISLGFHATVMAGAGDPAMHAMDEIAAKHKGGYVLVVDGATQDGENGLYCGVGEKDGKPITGYDHVRDLGRDALAVLAVGTCSSFGGIPAAAPNPTGAMSVKELFEREKITTPLVHIPGCPPHPDWIVGPIATVLLGGLKGLKLDELARPAPFYGPLIHDNCPYRGHFDEGKLAEHFGEHGCLARLGCKGPMTRADCSTRQWNGGTNWCIGNGHPCIGCTEPQFPFPNSMFEPVKPADMAFPGTYPVTNDGVKKEADFDTYATVGMIGVGGFLAGAGVVAAGKQLNGDKSGKSKADPTPPDAAEPESPQETE